jgi:hypothetical protein
MSDVFSHSFLEWIRPKFGWVSLLRGRGGCFKPGRSIKAIFEMLPTEFGPPFCFSFWLSFL